MASFKELRDLLVICYDSKMISDEEFLISYDKFQFKNPDFNYENYPAFDLDDMSSADCYADFHFQNTYCVLLKHYNFLQPSDASNEAYAMVSKVYACYSNLLRILAGTAT